jgi:PKD repeat protein
MKNIAYFVAGIVFVACSSSAAIGPSRVLAQDTALVIQAGQPFCHGCPPPHPEVVTPVVATGAALSAAPTSGPAPLTVNFRSEAPAGVSVGSAIDFGDGQAGAMQPAPVCFGCNAIAIAQHTYTRAGTYTAKLLAQWQCPPGQMQCPAAPAAQSIDGMTISVTR